MYSFLRKLVNIGTPIGRRRLAHAIRNGLLPLSAPLAHAHRKTVGRRTRVAAVVGSFGKTTTTAAVATALGLPDTAASEARLQGGLAFSRARIRPWQRYAVLEVAIDRLGQMDVHGWTCPAGYRRRRSRT